MTKNGEYYPICGPDPPNNLKCTSLISKAFHLFQICLPAMPMTS